MNLLYLRCCYSILVLVLFPLVVSSDLLFAVPPDLPHVHEELVLKV